MQSHGRGSGGTFASARSLSAAKRPQHGTSNQSHKVKVLCAYLVASSLLIFQGSSPLTDSSISPLQSSPQRTRPPIVDVFGIMTNTSQEMHPASMGVNKDDLVIPVNPPLRLIVGGAEMLG
jgi:hypothetical protein